MQIYYHDHLLRHSSPDITLLTPSLCSNVNLIFAAGNISPSGTYQQHYATSRTTLTTGLDSGTLTTSGLPVLNSGSSNPVPTSNPKPVPSSTGTTSSTSSPSSSSCSLTIGKATTKFSKCQAISGGTMYFTLSGSTLKVGFKSSSTSGWAAFAVGQNMIGANAVFAQTSGSGAKPYTATMTSFNPSSWSSPGNGGFTGVTAGHSGSNLAATFSMSWPGSASSIPVMFGQGPMSGSTMQRHRNIPRMYTLSKSTLKLA